MELLRAAGANEQRCIVRDVLGLYGYIEAIATYEGSSLPDKNFLYEVLKRCIVQHPVLSTVVQGAESKKPQLVRAHTINLDKHLRYSNLPDERNLRDRLLEIHNEPPLEYKSIPQWRVWIYPIRNNTSSQPSFQAAFACSHAVADGISLYIFHQSFLRALSEVKNFKPSNDATFQVRSEHELLPALENVAKMPVSWSLLLPRAIAEFAPSFIKTILGLNDDDAEGTWCGAGERPQLPPPGKLLTTALETLLVPDATVQETLKVCRAHNGRMTALVDHLATRALAHALKKRGQSYSVFEVSVPINLRRVIPQGRNQMANYPTAIEQQHDTTANPEPASPLSQDDWETIRRNTAELEKMANTLNDQPIALLTYVSDIKQMVLSRATKPTNTAFSMSNLGTFLDDRESEQGWRITEMVFSQSADATSAVCGINMATVKNGPLAITLTWWPGMLGVDDEEQFARDVLKSIECQLRALS